MNKHIKEAIKVLKQGGIVIFPTDTAFGIGCRMDDEQAVEKLFSIRKRPNRQAVPVLFSSTDMVRDYVTDIPEKVMDDLMLKYWPGAVTIILPAQLKKVPKLVRGGGITIGTRIPAHEIPLSLIQGLKVPLIGTSANFHGEPTPYKLANIDPKLHYLVDYLVPGTTSLGKESTVIDCSAGSWKVVRQGAVELKL
jgi:L-threonylcarbamoyladenylate synthase